MSYCTTYPLAYDLNYCSAEDGVIHLGELDMTYQPPIVVLTNLATGRKQVVELVGELPSLDITQPTDLVPGQAYLVTVGDELLFTPYVLDADGEGEPVLADEPVPGVTVTFVKLFGDGIHSTDEQWLTLK